MSKEEKIKSIMGFLTFCIILIDISMVMNPTDLYLQLSGVYVNLIAIYVLVFITIIIIFLTIFVFLYYALKIEDKPQHDYQFQSNTARYDIEIDVDDSDSHPTQLNVNLGKKFDKLKENIDENLNKIVEKPTFDVQTDYIYDKSQRKFGILDREGINVDKEAKQRREFLEAHFHIFDFFSDFSKMIYKDSTCTTFQLPTDTYVNNQELNDKFFQLTQDYYNNYFNHKLKAYKGKYSDTIQRMEEFTKLLKSLNAFSTIIDYIIENFEQLEKKSKGSHSFLNDIYIILLILNEIEDSLKCLKNDKFKEYLSFFSRNKIKKKPPKHINDYSISIESLKKMFSEVFTNKQKEILKILQKLENYDYCDTILLREIWDFTGISIEELFSIENFFS